MCIIMTHLLEPQRLRIITCRLIIPLVCISIQGCVKHTYKAEPLNITSVLNEFNSWSVDNPDLIKFLELNGVTVESLNSSMFSIKRLYLTGLFYSPEMQTAYKQWKQAKIVTENTGYRINPELSIQSEYDTDSSEPQSLIGPVLNFIYERRGKREARHAGAEVQLLNARLVMEKLAIDSYVAFQRQYQAYVVTLTRIAEIKYEIDVIKELLDLLQNKYELGAVSQFEISTIKLELQQRLFDLSLQENILDEQKNRLLTMTYLAQSEYEKIDIEHIHPLTFTKKLYQNSDLLKTEVSMLKYRMLQNNPGMALQLNTYAQSEATLRLEIEKQYPDIVLSPGFLFEQTGSIWTLSASWILPLFDNSKQNLQVLKALEERKVKQQEIIALQKKLLNSLYQMHRSILRQEKTIKISDEIIAAIEKRGSTIQKQIELGGIDRIVFLRNRMEFYKAKQTQTDIYHNAINAMLEIERLLQSSHLDIDINKVVASWLVYIEEKNSNESVN
jgi:outer membrane protein, heavy metal efflux system